MERRPIHRVYLNDIPLRILIIFTSMEIKCWGTLDCIDHD